LIFRGKIGDVKVTVSITPTGYADAPVFDVSKESVKFVMPLEEEMAMNKFLDIIENSSSLSGVHYIQKQERIVCFIGC
jgi:hypothetical protein